MDRSGRQAGGQGHFYGWLPSTEAYRELRHCRADSLHRKLRKYTAYKVSSQRSAVLMCMHRRLHACLEMQNDKGSKTGLQVPAEEFVKPELEQHFRHEAKIKALDYKIQGV